MRRIALHRHARNYFQRRPRDRQTQVRAALQAVAALPDPASSPNVRPMSGEWVECLRLRVGSYRVVLRVIPPELPDAPDGTLEVLVIGPRGDVYK
ncbi:MAG: type II toxin-antitoxin system RelE/ParE family toxin [Chthoniobacteraceae bacterium]